MSRRASIATLIAVVILPSFALAEPSVEQKIEVLTEELERLKKEVRERPTATGETAHGSGAGKTSLGGYGELHYNNLENNNVSKKEIDFHRFVLFFGHELTNRIRFFSELELEHSVSGEGKTGETELEQAFVEFDVGERHAAKGGLFLLPVGILNETHEPPTFYGVERNPVEKNIIPTSWWACGGAIQGEIAPGWSYDAAIHSGLKTSATKSFKVRDGRQKCGNAAAEDLAYTGRIKWTGIAGLEVGATLQHQADVTQGTDVTVGSGDLFEVHTAITRGRFGFRALYAMWDLDGTGPASIGADKQEGFYVEPSWKFTPSVGVFARYNEWDNTAGSGSATNTKKKQTDVGINYWPHKNVVLKADIQSQRGAADDDGFNLGIGFMF